MGKSEMQTLPSRLDGVKSSSSAPPRLTRARTDGVEDLDRWKRIIDLPKNPYAGFCFSQSAGCSDSDRTRGGDQIR